jgi:hypothetical protein
MADRGPPPNHDPFGPRWVGHGPANEHPDAEQARLYDLHKRGGTLGLYYEMYPLARPWTYGLTPEEIAVALGRQDGGRERGR